MARKKPNIYVGNTVKKRDRLSFKEFVIDVIEDTFINEFTPTDSTLDGDLFTVILGPVNNSPSGSGDTDFTDDQFVTGSQIQQEPDIEGYRFVYEELQVDNVKDYIDIYLYGVRQPEDKYSIEIYKYESGSLEPPTKLEGTVVGMQEIRFIFNESITRVPEDVDIEDWDIKGKIKEIE